MKFGFMLLGISLAVLPVAVRAQSVTAPASASQQAGFLEPGREYHIVFAGDRPPFSFKKIEFVETQEVRPDGSLGKAQRVPRQSEYILDIFRVVKFPGGNWVLVEHPAFADGFEAWHAKHKALLLLSQSGERSAQEVSNLTESAMRAIPLTQTWINIDHAITIKPVSEESLRISRQ
ncbi:MAG: hypothetical protein R3C18_25535 [Planctomycetaceae bacterium]